MQDELKQYEVEPDAPWQSTWRYGDGYDVMGVVERYGWRVIAFWGRDGYDLGSWPLVMVFFRRRNGHFEIAYYVEGDVVMYRCPSEAIRNAITDGLAFFHWKKWDEEWVRGYETVEQLPPELRGPYRSA